MYRARLLLAVFLACVPPCAALLAQDIILRPPANDLFVRWDSLNHRVLYHRVSLTPSLPAIYVADPKGHQTLTIDVLKDFPGALHGTLEVENVEGGPDGSVVLFCLLDYGVRPLKGLILTYSASGLLKNTIDTAYEASAVTVDEEGNIYIFGSNDLYDVDDPQAVYPTIVKYDSAGRIAKTMLPSSNFVAGDYPTDYSDQNGGPLLRLTAKGIAVFAALSGKWFLLSPEGQIIAQSDLSRLTRDIADRYHFRRGSVNGSFLDPNGSPVFNLRLDDGPFDESNVPPPDQIRFRASLVRSNPITHEFAELETEARPEGGLIIGIAANGNIVRGSLQEDGSAGIGRLGSARPK